MTVVPNDRAMAWTETRLTRARTLMLLVAQALRLTFSRQHQTHHLEAGHVHAIGGTPASKHRMSMPKTKANSSHSNAVETWGLQVHHVC